MDVVVVYKDNTSIMSPIVLKPKLTQQGDSRPTSFCYPYAISLQYNSTTTIGLYNSLSRYILFLILITNFFPSSIFASIQASSS
jgi:hypothetical protein